MIIRESRGDVFYGIPMVPGHYYFYKGAPYELLDYLTTKDYCQIKKPDGRQVVRIKTLTYIGPEPKAMTNDKMVVLLKKG